MTNKGGLIFKKQEMTKLWIEDKFESVTLLSLADQEIIRYKTPERDGYWAAVIGVDKKTLDKEKGQKEKFSYVTEFKVDEDFANTYEVGSKLSIAMLENVEKINIIGTSKGKGYQGVIKRHNFSAGPKTHGSHHVRGMGSTGNMKPNRVNKGQPMPGHMGTKKVTLKNVELLDKIDLENENLIAVKGSVPGFYNSLLEVEV